ncbi:MAG TPA: helix-turn-helix domain-containing protein, partial [Acidimicrobiales bacterium]|nr:helix-turn-helix domain-containing protein [Acidimicrobiales bacterium]
MRVPTAIAATTAATTARSVATPTASDASVRARLVTAAAEVFAERGYEGARVQEIVRRAGLSTGAIYTNFRNKADLLLA